MYLILGLNEDARINKEFMNVLLLDYYLINITIGTVINFFIRMLLEMDIIIIRKKD